MVASSDAAPLPGSVATRAPSRKSLTSSTPLVASCAERSKLAERLLDEIYEDIAEDSRHNAAVFVAEHARAPRRLAKQPRSGRIVPELGDPDLFEVIHRGYRILYRIEDVIEIVAIADGRRDLRQLADEHRF